MKKLARYLFLATVLFMSAFLIIKATNQSPNQIPKKAKNHIPIAMATDNNFIYPTSVAITSLLENRKKNTAIDLNIMISGDVSKENRVALKKFEKLYKNCTVNLINMRNHFKKTYIQQRRISTPTYYRLNLPNLLKKYDKILYLDGDIIVTKDLWKLYCTDIDDCYIAGALDVGIDKDRKTKPQFEEEYSEKLNVGSLDQYVNAGILVMNLKKMREDNMQQIFNDFIPKLKERKLMFNDQDILNSTCYGKIQIFPQKYNAFSHLCVSKTVSPNTPYSCDKPVIIHYTGSRKPWKTKTGNLYSVWEKYSKIAIRKLGKNIVPSNKKAAKETNKPDSKKQNKDELQKSNDKASKQKTSIKKEIQKTTQKIKRHLQKATQKPLSEEQV